MKFYKYSSTGNKFIVIDDISKLQTIFQMIGENEIDADGVIVISNSEMFDASIRVFNKDTSEAKTCGNGLKLLPKYLKEVKKLNKKVYFVQFNDVIYKVGVDRNIYFAFFSIPKLISFNEKEALVDNVNMHLIKVVDRLDFKQLIEEGLKYFDVLNYHQVMVTSPKEVEMITFERGVGPTFSCGSGAIATFYYLRNLNLVNEKIKIKTRGGLLELAIINNEIMVSGKVKKIYEGKCN